MKVKFDYHTTSYDYGHVECLTLTATIGRWQRKWGAKCISVGCMEHLHGHAMENLQSRFWRYIGAK